MRLDEPVGCSVGNKLIMLSSHRLWARKMWSGVMRLFRPVSRSSETAWCLHVFAECGTRP